jgi:hypothetical protein
MQARLGLLLSSSILFLYVLMFSSLLRIYSRQFPSSSSCSISRASFANKHLLTGSYPAAKPPLAVALASRDFSLHASPKSDVKTNRVAKPSGSSSNSAPASAAAASRKNINKKKTNNNKNNNRATPSAAAASNGDGENSAVDAAELHFSTLLREHRKNNSPKRIILLLGDSLGQYRGTASNSSSTGTENINATVM